MFAQISHYYVLYLLMLLKIQFYFAYQSFLNKCFALNLSAQKSSKVLIYFMCLLHSFIISFRICESSTKVLHLMKQLIGKFSHLPSIPHNTAETYLRHPNSYLPNYNIQSETDGESIPLTRSNDAMMVSNRMGQQRILMKNGVDIGPHQIVQSDEDDVPAYGFPSQKRRNRIEQSDLELNKGGRHA